MTLDEARQIIRDPSAPFAWHVEAAAMLASSKHSELSDLIRCLRFGGLPAETAAIALYTRTGRPHSGHISDFIADSSEWLQYLARQFEVAAS